MENQYYIVSNKHTDGDVRKFWKPDRNGYTIDLSGAGIYGSDNRYPIVTKDNLDECDEYDTFLIAVEDIELIGKKVTCILAE